MLWIVSGPTSAGKSTFLKSPLSAEMSGLPEGSPIIFPASQPETHRTEDYSNSFYHYNILNSLRKSTPPLQADFRHDEKWREILEVKVEKKAIVVVSSAERITERIRVRNRVEERRVEGMKRNSYPRKYWLDKVQSVDLADWYAAWCKELLVSGIPYVLVNGNGGSYPVIESEELIRDVVEGRKPMYSRNEIQRILKTRDFEYHRVDLPHGLHTGGSNRSRTRDLILPKSLSGNSVLDVGCALGYFCFEAEDRGAKRVVGIELMGKRFNNAQLLKDIRGSKVKFMRRDVVENPLEERFDHVLLLNVVHHLKEPFRAIRQLASITNKRMVIEFPTLSDKKFRRASNIRFPFLLNRMPLVGVSSLKGADQTFVFSPAAMKRSLLDHERLFEKVDIIKSPMPERAIAICYKR